MVLETGRGARFDEVGGIASAVSVITSILPEHLDRLGPSEANVAWHKLAIVENSSVTVLGPTAAYWYRRQGGQGRVTAVKRPQGPFPPPSCPCSPVPDWLALDRALAARALECYGLSSPDLVPVVLPSFGRGRLGGLTIVYEAAVQPASLDEKFLTALRSVDRPPACVVSLPDDKDVAGVEAKLTRAGFQPAFVALEGQRGALSHSVVQASPPACLAGRCRFDDVDGLKKLLIAHAEQVGARSLYLVGTQTFIRLVRRALDGELLPQP